MKLQKVKAYKLAKDRWQFKYQITVPETTIDKLGWKEGNELKDTIKGESLVIDLAPDIPKKPRRVITTKLTYPQFRDEVRRVLQYSDGLTWTQVRNQLKLDQVVPNNKWVRQMEKDIGLQRVKVSDGSILWRLNHVGR